MCIFVLILTKCLLFKFKKPSWKLSLSLQILLNYTPWNKTITFKIDFLIVKHCKQNMIIRLYFNWIICHKPKTFLINSRFSIGLGTFSNSWRRYCFYPKIKIKKLLKYCWFNKIINFSMHTITQFSLVKI